MKKLKSRFKHRRRFFAYSLHNETFFYRHYFAKEAGKLQIPITDFYDPLNNDVGTTKTINRVYLARVLSVKNFRSDLIRYVGSKSFKREYQLGIRNKLLKILERFEGLFRDSNRSSSKDLPKKIKKYFQKNKQCKLPWTEKEIDSSVYDFYSILLDK